MRRLLLLRHAKSLRDDALSDKDRPLAARGRSDSPRMGSYMHHKRYLPQLVLCSTAKRTVETWELLGPELDASTQARFPDALYLASASMIESLIRAAGIDVSALLVIGHNPGLEECARMFARESPADEERRLGAALKDKFPTCALAVLDFDIDDWNDAAARSGKLVDFARPKDLKGK
jgi:phosphohistidine phosphatase